MSHESHEDSSFVHAREDMDDEQQRRLTELMTLVRDTHTPSVGSVPKKHQHAKKLWDIFENGIGVAAGRFELLASDVPRVNQLVDEIRADRVARYRYRVSDRLIRGSRRWKDDLERITRLDGMRATVNLCAEMHHGDDRIIHDADVDLKTLHLPIVDNETPSTDEICKFLTFVGNEDYPVYVHCEQGIGRTGVIIGCYRMVVHGWSCENAVGEAKRFGLRMPEQIDFLEDLGHRVDELKNDCLPPDYEDRTRDEPNANVTREDCITTDAEEETTGGPASPAT